MILSVCLVYPRRRQPSMIRSTVLMRDKTTGRGWAHVLPLLRPFWKQLLLPKRAKQWQNVCPTPAGRLGTHYHRAPHATSLATSPVHLVYVLDNQSQPAPTDT